MPFKPLRFGGAARRAGLKKMLPQNAGATQEGGRCHLRARGDGHTVTISEHRPRSHQAHLEWTPSRMVHWARTTGPTRQLLVWDAGLCGPMLIRATLGSCASSEHDGARISRTGEHSTIGSMRACSIGRIGQNRLVLAALV